MVGLALILGLVLAGCKQVYEMDGPGGQKVTITLKKSKYEITFNGQTDKGKSTRKKVTYNYGGVGYAICNTYKDKLSELDHVGSFNMMYDADSIGGPLNKKAVDADGNEYDIEVIFDFDDEEDDEDEGGED
jgi:hypothetical protein